MEEKLNELKEKQARIGDKISLLRKTNQKKDEEAAEIRQLIAECRENLNRIKGIAPGNEAAAVPCPEIDDWADILDSKSPEKRESENQGVAPVVRGESPSKRDSRSSSQSKAKESIRSEPRVPPINEEVASSLPIDEEPPIAASTPIASPPVVASSPVASPRGRSGDADNRNGSPKEKPKDEENPDASLLTKLKDYGTDNTPPRNKSKDEEVAKAAPAGRGSFPGCMDSTPTIKDGNGAGFGNEVRAPKIEDKYKPFDRKRCAEILARRECLEKRKAKAREKISCKVDLNTMKVRLRGPSEDLKKLDAAQLICLLEKFQCQELIINTGDETPRDPGEVRCMYFLHPGNIVMLAGIVLLAFFIHSNLCNHEKNNNRPFLLNTLYLGSFAFHCGMVLWMTFMRGYALKFGLSTENYHLVDNLLLPKYYALCVLLSAVSLYSFLAIYGTVPFTSWPLEVFAQLIVEVVTFMMELIAICYIIPALIKLREATDDYVGDDDECDPNVPDSYVKNQKKLKKISRTVCLMNFLSVLLLGANIYYLTSKLKLLAT